MGRVFSSCPIFFGGLCDAYGMLHISMLGIRGAVARPIGPWLVDCLMYRGFFLLVALMNIAGFLMTQTLFKCVADSSKTMENTGLTRMDNSVNLRE